MWWGWEQPEGNGRGWGEGTEPRGLEHSSKGNLCRELGESGKVLCHSGFGDVSLGTELEDR